MQSEESDTALLPISVDPSHALPAAHLSNSSVIQSAPFVRTPPGREEGEEIARLGKEWYDQKIRAEVEPQHNGKFMSIDVDTGEYTIGDAIHSAARQLIARKPNVRLYGLRVGLGYLGRI